MQSEFVSATLHLSLHRGDLSIERPRDSDHVIAQWGEGDDAYQVSLPARAAAGEVVPGTGVEHLSDLLFWLSGVKPPRVRKSKAKDDSETTRTLDAGLALVLLPRPGRDRQLLLPPRRQRGVLHAQQEPRCFALRSRVPHERQALSATIAGLTQVLQEVGIESEAQILGRVVELQARAEALEAEITAAREAAEAERRTTHAADDLREAARSLGEQIATIDDAILDLRQTQDRDRRHLHEIETLSLKFRRSISAKAVLIGVTFQSCPRCTQRLPERDRVFCRVCGQPDQLEAVDPTEAALIERDTKVRAAELTDISAKHDESLSRLRREREMLQARKARVERERNETLSRYNSAYLSSMLTNERARASLLQEAENLAALTRLPRTAEAQRDELTEIAAREQRLRVDLKAARKAAETDATNLDRLKVYFLDCLVRAGVPGITEHDRVEISTTSFFPELYGRGPGRPCRDVFRHTEQRRQKDFVQMLFRNCGASAGGTAGSTAAGTAHHRLANEEHQRTREPRAIRRFLWDAL